VSAAEDRYLMTVIATASNPRFGVSRVDIDRTGPTYTVDTITDIAAMRPGAELFFITGADALGAILSWKEAEQALRLAHFIGVTRPGYALSDAHLPTDAVTLVDVPALAISSSACRDRVAAGRPIWYLVPDGVVQYIAKRHLYRGDGDYRGQGDYRLDEAADDADRPESVDTVNDAAEPKGGPTIGAVS
jgi:nicotinate-nucleotide adenylyltransferase